MSDSNKLPQVDYRLKNLTNALYLTPGDDVAIRTGISGNINIAGDVNVPGNIQVYSSSSNPVHTHITEVGTSGILNTAYMPVGGTVTVLQGSLPWYTSVNNFPTSTTITSGNIGIYGNIAGITTLPAINIASMPEVEIKNDSGNPISVSRNANVNSTTNRIYVSMETDAVVADSNYEMNVARGLVTGQYSVERSAYIPATPNAETSIWVEGGIYPHGTWTSASLLYIASSSAADTNLRIFVEGLNSAYVYQSEYVNTNDTNGTTTVQTANTYIRIYTATIVSASSNSSNAGDIRFRITSSSGTIVAHIGIGIGVTKLSQYTVPDGYTAYILYGDVATFKNGAGNQSGLIKMMVRPFGGSFVGAFMAQVSNGYYRNDFKVPLAVPAKADIDVRILTDATGATVSSNYQMILIPN